MSIRLQWGARTWLMGVVNLTPDSFSGDGLATPDRSDQQRLAAALEQARRFVDAGAEIIDVGAASSRPRAAYGDHPEVDAATEASIAVPVVRAVAEELGDRALISIDTDKGVVARAATEAGARIVNDVWGGRRDAGTAAAAAASAAHFVVMHNGEGVDYAGDPFGSVVGWLHEAIEGAMASGMSRDRLIIDPGIGFGKSTEVNLELLHRLAELKAAVDGLPLLVGTSRKRFLGELLDGAGPTDRLEGTAATVALAIAAGADMVRVHDVAEMDRVRRVADAVVRR